MNDNELDKLIILSLKACEKDFPEESPPEEEHIFSEQFEINMKKILNDSPPKSIRVWKWWFVLAAVLLAMMACSLTVYGSKTNQIHFFADNFEEYEPLETMAEDAPFSAELTYDLDSLLAKYESGVEIINGEQYTRFFINPDTGEFFEFSSYPKLFFRYHYDTEQQKTELFMLGDKHLTYFQDRNGIQYALWSGESSVFVVRSDMSREQFLEDVNSIQIYEIT